MAKIIMDREREVKYNLKALSKFEKEIGKTMQNVKIEDLTIEEQVALCWAGLIKDDPSIEVDELYEILDEYDCMETLAKAVVKELETYYKKKSNSK